jgi:hypothetical protein
MEDVKVELQFSDAFPHSDRDAIHRAFTDEGIDAKLSDRDIFYKGGSVSPENLIIGFIVTFPVLQFLQGYFSAAGADAWEATKRALKKARKAHDGGQEANIDDADGKTYANYIIPNDPSQQDAAIDAIAADFAALTEVDERWWLGPPDSRWGTGMESAQQNKKLDDNS